MQINLTDYIESPKIDTSVYENMHRSEDLFYRICSSEGDLSAKKISEYKIALLGITEDRNSNNKGAAQAADIIREQLYRLYIPDNKIKLIDLGNLKQGKSVKDTYRALLEVYSFLLTIGTIPVIIGGTQDLVYSIFQSYHFRKQPFNFTNIDARFDLGSTDDGFDNSSFLSKIIKDNSPFLFNYTHIGYQTYYSSNADINLLDELWFDCIRLGTARGVIPENEPYLRDSDFVCIDINAVKQSDAPAHKRASVHGFYGEEMCQLGKYAGLSDRLSGFGLFEMNPELDRNNQTAELSAQIIWHFVQGVWLRKKDFPNRPVTEYRKFIVQMQEGDSDLIFYKNPKTGRWWMEIPYLDRKKEKIIVISCSYADYQTATDGEVPERWWRFFQKLSRASEKR